MPTTIGYILSNHEILDQIKTTKLEDSGWGSLVAQLSSRQPLLFCHWVGLGDFQQVHWIQDWHEYDIIKVRARYDRYATLTFYSAPRSIARYTKIEYAPDDPRTRVYHGEERR